MAAVDEHLVRRERRPDRCCFTPPFDQTRARSRLHQGLPARRARERRPVHARRGLGGDRVRRARRRRQGRRAVRDAQPDQSRAARAPASSATRSSPTSSPATSTPSRRTSGAAAGPGTPARPAGCTARASSGSSASACAAATLRIDPCIPRAWRGFEIAFRYHSARYEIAVENPRGVTRGVSRVELDGVRSTAAGDPARRRRRDAPRARRARMTAGAHSGIQCGVLVKRPSTKPIW